MAKSMLENKAQDYKANAILVTKDEGFFHSEMEADGYKCKEGEGKVGAK